MFLEGRGRYLCGGRCGGRASMYESGGLSLDVFMGRELLESGYSMTQEWVSDTNSDLVIFNLTLPEVAK